ncbi:response regulator [Dysgonomonas sp. Marseille-P4677]|uniref:hybrid sensor histidine kinase/response regulator transcription factor n=1 Tax=Dysgonomonas sp. Marseille-P4677 TaxID=2364790 RepID=UPI001913E171|nr:hybrid sensor histidine kinase/response regulator transcription factor [Dysgonomonas sp. Marseille-P4677]MBK5721058.1 response regulator [Dysgonomonas sp. Marseille-P4677]
MKYIFLGLSLILFLPIYLKGGNYRFSQIDGNIGLSHNNVKSICQDSYGFMWFGTRNRLNRYDGITCKVFNCYDSETKRGNNNISALFEGPDKELWVGTDKGVFIFDPVAEKFSSFDLQSKEGVSIIDWITDIRQDNNNNIWIVAPNQGVFRYNLKTKKLHYYIVVKDLSPSQSNPQCIAIEKSGRVWIGANGAGIFLYNSSNDTFTQYLGDADGQHSLAGKNIYTICHDKDHIIVGIHEENLLRLDKRRNTLEEMDTREINKKIIRCITPLNDNEIWVGTQYGLFIINDDTNSIIHAIEDPINSYSLSDNFIECVYEDREGGIWIGTNFGGVNYYRNRNDKFEKYFPTSDPGSINSHRIRELVEDKSGDIWVGTDDAGVFIFNTETQKFKALNSLYPRQALAMLALKTAVWIGYFKDGLDIVERPQNKITHYSADVLQLNEESIYALCEDRYGNIWLGNGWGVFVRYKNSSKFERLNIFGLSFIFDIIEDSEGYIWIATMGSGVFQYDQNKDKVIHYTHTDENSISSNSVSSITEDHLGQIWFSTDRGGICVFNKEEKKFKSYSIKDGLPDDIAYKILEDKNYNLWFGTNKGLVRFNPQTKQVRVFTQNEGLLSNQFNYKSALKSNSGKLYFGCLEGLIAFTPEEFQKNTFIPPVYITKLSLFNKEINPNEKGSPLAKSIVHTDKITLPYNETNITLNFVSLSYIAPLANKYAFKMDGIDADWIYTQNNNSASYSNLHPGKYLFRVKASNNDELWNEREAQLEIIILPPWWASKIAYIIYIVLFCAITYYVIYFSIKRYKKRGEEQQRLFEIEKERELYETKVDFFTEIAHEIRTPVTLISGPLEAIIEQQIPDEGIKRNLQYIKQNTNNLLDLINQLLDFRKVDSHKFLINLKIVDVSALLKENIEKFRHQALTTPKKVNINFTDDNLEPVLAAVDREGITKIINNLLSNAMKYSSKNIEILITHDDVYFTIEVINDGVIVPDEFKEKIFEPFFQVKALHKDTTGSGIGLSLARTLAELHDGYLFYSSANGLNNFILKVPISHEQENTDDINILIENDSDQYIYNQDNLMKRKLRPETILIVEDNTDMLSFISNEMQAKYEVIKATNGTEAFQILKQEMIDIVISDIMMPGMDGFELCQTIKTDIELSHIIVILLTARNDLNSKIKGLEIGADAYVEKPFSLHYLQTLIVSLINNRRRDMKLLTAKPFMSMNQTGMSKANEQFLNKIIEIINKNIAEPSFSVESLSEAMHMSRSSLHRKIKSIIDSSPTDFIRLIRLQKAAELIQDGKYRINEICYLVGFNSPSYFIKLFQNHYGMTPKDFEKQSKEMNK